MCASLVSTTVIAVVGIKMEQCLSSGTWLGTILRAHSRYTVLQVNQAFLHREGDTLKLGAHNGK